jgi:ABC-type uncharacterized transport system involved in gliding motility auxiliary subunit
MPALLERIRSVAVKSFCQAIAFAERLDRRTLAWGAIGLAAVILFAVNLFASTALREVKFDLTQDRLFTISEGTVKTLRAIDEPITVRVYFSKKLGEEAPTYLKSFERVRSLLEQYNDISGGRLQISFLDPEPFSDAEDRAVAAGLRGLRLNQEGDLGYFGLVASNSTDNEATIAFFAPERDRFLEYDVTKTIYSLASPKKRVVGLISSLPLDGGMAPIMGMGERPIPPQLVMDQIRELFDVKTLGQDVKEIASDIDVLMIVQPDNLNAEAAYAIDQYVLGGGKVLLFVDPVAETNRAGPMPPAPSGKNAELDKLLKAWGISYDPSKVAGDIAHARRVQFGGGLRPTVTEYVVWLGLDRSNLDQNDVLAVGIDHLNLASAGILTKAEGASTVVTPIIQTSAQAMQISADRVAMMPDAVGLLRNYKSEGKPFMLAARVSGQAKSAFADGAPDVKAVAKDGAAVKGDAADKVDTAAADKSTPSADNGGNKTGDSAKASKSHKAAGNINVIILADTDLLNDQFWVEIRDFLGSQVAIPHAHNAAFVVGALENLSGSDALISLRGRGVIDRPFDLVEDLRRDAERQFRDKEQALTTKLKDVQDQLAKLEQSGDGENVLLTDKDRQAIEKFRAEMLNVRRELRDVKHELRKDIDHLDGVLKFANIAAVPLLVGIGGVGVAVYRRRHVRAA